MRGADDRQQQRRDLSIEGAVAPSESGWPGPRRATNKLPPMMGTANAVLLFAAAGAALAPPGAPPHVLVAGGDLRLSALSRHVLRLERRGPRGFEDAPTFLALNRSAWVAEPAVALSAPIAGADGTYNVTVGSGSGAVVVVIATRHRDAETCWTNSGALSLFPTAVAGPAVHAADAGECCAACDAMEKCTSWMFNERPQVHDRQEVAAPPPPAGSCSSRLSHGVDVSGPSVIRGNESLQCNMSLTDCCSACDKSPRCTALVLAAPSSWSVCPNLPYCFLLSSYKATHSKPGSTLGTKGGGPPPAPAPPPSAHPNCALNLGYGETHIGGETFGCPRRGCAAAWSGRWQGGDLGRSFRQPPLSMHASVYSVATGELLGTSDDASAPLDFPSPSDLPGVFAVQDSPRFLVPEGGAIPQSQHAMSPELQNTSGYDIRNQADDVYLFISAANFTRLKRDFIALTGPVPRLPDWAFGTWFTEWHNYSQAVAEQEMLRWAERKLPLSVWGLDINWRNNGFGGNKCTEELPGLTCEWYYNQTNTTRLPNITALFSFEHQRGLRTYLNDHPKNMAPETSPYEIKFRYDGLVSMLEKGADFWWYDPNWHIGIEAPFNLEGHVWGAHVYTSVVTSFNKQAAARAGGATAMRRPLMLGIADASHPAAHRYPVWWTGDDKSLSYSVNSMVQLGVSHLKPYVHSDCGGVADKETGLVAVPEYVRWSQHCALGAIHRYHGGPGHQPWIYPEDVESIVRSFLNLRMTLMPMLLAAGETATLDATPIARRLDLAFPAAGPNASRTDQYLLGDDLLVAPFLNPGVVPNGTATREVWLPPGSAWQDAWTGATIAGPQTVLSTQPLSRVPMWHRKGGVLVTAPVAQTVEEQDWSELGLEIFPCAINGSEAGGAQPQQRRRVVREGEAGEGTTVFTRQTDAGRRLSVEIVPGEGTPARAWIVRVNLPRGHVVVSPATLDGAALSAEDQVLIAPRTSEEASSDFFPLRGRGASPAREAGGVAELRLASARGWRHLELQLDLARGPRE